MINISSILKNIFRRLFILLCIIEFLLLIIILYFYKDSVNEINEETKQMTKLYVEDNRRLLQDYIYNKLKLCSEDLLLVVRLHQEIEKYFASSDFRDDIYDDEYIENECSINGYKIPFTKEYLDLWYKNETTIKSRSKGTWTFNKKYEMNELSLDEKQFLKILCFINPILEGILLKQLKWKKIFPISYQYIFFVYYNSFFYKFPVFYNSYMMKEYQTNDCSKELHKYEPKCRPFYINSMKSKSKLVMTVPYKSASSNQYQSELCIKSLNTVNYEGTNYPYMLFCINLNLEDILGYSYHLKKIVGDKNLQLYFIVKENDKKDFTVMASSDYLPEDYINYGSKLNKSNEANSLFECLNRNIFEKSFDNKKLDNKLYEEVANYYSNNIYNKIDEIYNKNIANETISRNFTLKSNYYWNNMTNETELIKVDYIYYLLPIYTGIDYDNDFKISMNNKSKIYLLFINESKEEENIKNFYNILVYEICLFFILLTSLNVMIYAIFNFSFHYFLKFFLNPINIINDFFENIYFHNDKEYLEKNKLDVLCKIDDLKADIQEDKPNFIRNILNLRNYQEINECLLNLKIIKIIHTANDDNFEHVFDYKNIDKTLKMGNIIDVLFYLMNFEIKGENLDSDIICEILLFNFIYLINLRHNTDKKKLHLNKEIDIKDIYIKFKKIAEDLIIDTKYKKNPNDDNIHRSELDNKAYKEIVDNLRFRYLIFKMNQIDNNYTNKNLTTYLDSYTQNTTFNLINQDIEKISEELLFDLEKFLNNENIKNNSKPSIKKIYSQIMKSKLLIDTKNESEAIRVCIRTLDDLKKFQNENQYGSLSKFALLPFTCIIYEKILYIFSLLSECFEQKKSQFIIYLNILDLCPIYEKNIRKAILNNIPDIIENSNRLQSTDSLDTEINQDDLDANKRLAQHKIKIIMYMNFKSKKNILFMLDSNFPFIKNEYFTNIILNNEINTHHNVSYCLFDDNLYFQRSNNNFNDHDNLRFVDDFSYLLKHYESDLSKINHFDKSLLDCMKIIDSIKDLDLNNYVIAFVNTSSIFEFNYDNFKRISSALCDYTLIICIPFETKRSENDKHYRKYLAYTKLVNEYLVNAILYVFTSYSSLRSLISLITKTGKRKFNIYRLKSLIKNKNEVSENFK